MSPMSSEQYRFLLYVVSVRIKSLFRFSRDEIADGRAAGTTCYEPISAACQVELHSALDTDTSEFKHHL